MRGQGATEFLLIVAFILLLILPVGYYLFTQTSESTRLIQADLAVSELAKTADYLYYQVPGAKQTVVVFVPSGIDWENSYMGHRDEAGGREINLATYTQTGGITDIYVTTQGEVRGYWPASNGNWRFQLTKMPDGYVAIIPYELGFLINPNSFTDTVEPNSDTSFSGDGLVGLPGGLFAFITVNDC